VFGGRANQRMTLNELVGQLVSKKGMPFVIHKEGWGGRIPSLEVSLRVAPSFGQVFRCVGGDAPVSRWKGVAGSG
jgi:hypothetical protein